MYADYNTLYGSSSSEPSIFLILFIMAIIYLVSSIPLYYMYKVANLKNPWAAFVPVYGQIKVFNLANLSMWYYLLLVVVAMIPFLGSLASFVFTCYLYWKVYENFGLGTGGRVLGILFPPLVNWYITLTKKDFAGTLDTKYTNY